MSCDPSAGNVFYKIEKPEQMANLISIIKRCNKPIFEGAAEAIKYLRDYEKY